MDAHVSADQETERQQEAGSRCGSHDPPPVTGFLQQEPLQISSTTSQNNVTIWELSAQTMWGAFPFNHSNSTKILVSVNQGLEVPWVC